MPELPDLHLYAINLARQLPKEAISGLRPGPRKRLNLPEGIFCQRILGRSIQRIDRHGKELFFHLDDGGYFGVHLMLNGKFYIEPKERAAALPGLVAAIGFEGGQALCIADGQGLCRVNWEPPKPTVPDAMSEEFTQEYFRDRARRAATRNIKEFLTDQKVVRGIGNAYVDEILWQAGVHPESVVGAIPQEAWAGLHSAIGQVFRWAIEEIGRINPDIIRGEERSFLKVHNPRAKTAPDGFAIERKQIAGKGTYFTQGQTLHR